MTSELEKLEAIEKVKVIKALIEITEVSGLLTTFFKAFLTKTIKKRDGLYYLHGNFNIGGTVSGRLSSSKVNLQNLPSSGSKYAELVKECFIAPGGWVRVGIDFDSLEDRISALTTNDPNKIKIYTDGYDGHSLRAYSYYGHMMPDIQDTVVSINTIAKKYPKQRQDSKGPTFALTYQGTWRTLVKNLGLTEKEAKEIEKNYHILYSVSDKWVDAKLKQASIDGYVTCAFGLRVRTPMLAQIVYGSSYIPFEAEAEGRTAGNALGQSYGLLNNRAGIEIQNELLKSKFKYDILPESQIHDAQYFTVRNTPEVLHWINEVAIKAVRWQKLKEIQNQDVPLGGSLEVFPINWVKKVKISNGATIEGITNQLKGEAC